ncbi:MAG TPA: Holliday junction branch migration protein RuvA [Phycicoccus sp.]|nr:Holliday junction branch migration protein RuvA [Phycicoccus sp.]HQH08769.1 Holliday junction branch migration protein RuvA [Phycicoccus sp.]HQK31473.1 Holliday junction branch migration protein RuvA [Phycicoccus sp.]HQY96337.1 Holliday junction branch migration protein RuvA [Phycicoccus sp.]HRA43924.1 Holliday junction branch migration protein RuvA [Phycicoccus sp.]
MISSLHGAVAHIGLDRITLVVGGVGLLVHVTAATAAGLRTGQEATVSTTLVVREDSLTLFGFASADERDMFETAQSVSGVGPRIALAMLSVMGPDELRTALATGDTKALTKIPGIGPKSAQRLVLELKDKVTAHAGGGASNAASGTVVRAGGTAWDQVSEALVGLGWSAKQSAEAVTAVSATAPADGDLAAYLRLALRELRR